MIIKGANMEIKDINYGPTKQYKCLNCGQVKSILCNHDQLKTIFNRCSDECMWTVKKEFKGLPLLSTDGLITGFSKVKHILWEG